MSTLLVSLLIGAGYDALVVSGYASKTTCNGDLSFDDCPLLRAVPPPPMPPDQRTCYKYGTRPAKQLRSKYEQMMAEREEAAIQAKNEQKRAEEMAQQAASISYTMCF